MKFGIILPSYIYSEERKKWAIDTFSSIQRTLKPINKPKLLLILKESSYTYPLEDLKQAFDLEVVTPEGVNGTEFTLAWGTERILADPEITHTIWMGDDAKFSPVWLQVLEQLIQRHPEAKSWSVYRSAYEEIHKKLKEEGDDVLVKSICGHGLTLAREEFIAWKQNRHIEDSWHCTQGNTLDLCHVHSREGERWVTSGSFVEHTGVAGLHCSPGLPEHAINFVGG